MSLMPSPILQAAGFTLGCLAIHTLRRHPEPVTRFLTLVALCLLAVAALAWANQCLSDSAPGGSLPIDLSQAL